MGWLAVGLYLMVGWIQQSDKPGKSETAPLNDQEITTPLLTPEQAAAAIKAPAGFKVTLFAGEPMVQQPISATFDHRGRLWVCENNTYARASTNFDRTMTDRIVILEDSNNDGKADSRKVFWDKAKLLTSVEIAREGVYVLAPPKLMFIPDAKNELDGTSDDKPDGEPIVLLDGFDENSVRHNLANGLRFGPDGWLYGRHGIQATSLVGPPGTLDDKRVKLNAGIWRYHPGRKIFEVVCHGTTNPWGMDWDQHGELFFINTVIGHLWHAVPGAHFKRMYGEDLFPNTYELIDQTADHVHWDTKSEPWNDLAKKGISKGTDAAGGGHAHAGLMIYQGGTWPEEYHNDLFTLNMHGRRINREKLERFGATYVGKHRPDLFHSSDAWFRGIDLMYGPDGNVFVLDWSDIGECHENDGVHRTSGRIYKLIYDKPADALSASSMHVTGVSEGLLIDNLKLKNEWIARQSRTELAYRATTKGLKLDMVLLLRDLLKSSETVTRLRAAWTLNQAGLLTKQDLTGMLDDENEHIRAWGVRLLSDTPVIDPTSIERLVRLARREKSGLVLCYLASAIPKLPSYVRFNLATAICKAKEFADDRVLPLQLWHVIEPNISQQPGPATEMFFSCEFPRVRQFIARRLAQDLEQSPNQLSRIVSRLNTRPNEALVSDLLAGMAQAFNGWRKVSPPSYWEGFVLKHRELIRTDSAKQHFREISVVFGDGRALDDVKKIALDSNQPGQDRRRAVASLIAAKAPDLFDLMAGQISDRSIGSDAVRAIVSADFAKAATILVERFHSMVPGTRLVAIESLASRGDGVTLLLNAIESKKIARGEVSPLTLRQIQLLGNAELSKRVAEMYPEQQLIAKDKLKLIETLRSKLSPDALKSADRLNGKVVFGSVCGKCHKLFNEGGQIGPELTGAQRSNINYWLENCIEPSLVVPENYRMTILSHKDGRTLSGVIVEEKSKVLVLQTPTDKITLERADIVERKQSTQSLMPEGLLTPLSDQQLRDLIAYLMK